MSLSMEDTELLGKKEVMIQTIGRQKLQIESNERVTIQIPVSSQYCF